MEILIFKFGIRIRQHCFSFIAHGDWKIMRIQNNYFGYFVSFPNHIRESQIPNCQSKLQIWFLTFLSAQILRLHLLESSQLLFWNLLFSCIPSAQGEPLSNNGTECTTYWGYFLTCDSIYRCETMRFPDNSKTLFPFDSTPLASLWNIPGFTRDLESLLPLTPDLRDFCDPLNNVHHPDGLELATCALLFPLRTCTLSFQIQCDASQTGGLSEKMSPEPRYRLSCRSVTDIA